MQSVFNKLRHYSIQAISIILLNAMVNSAHATHERQIAKLNGMAPSVNMYNSVHLPPNSSYIGVTPACSTVVLGGITLATACATGCSIYSLASAGMMLYSLYNKVPRCFEHIRQPQRLKAQTNSLTHNAFTALVQRQQEEVMPILERYLPRDISLLIMGFEGFGDRAAARTFKMLNTLMWRKDERYADLDDSHPGRIYKHLFKFIPDYDAISLIMRYSEHTTPYTHFNSLVFLPENLFKKLIREAEKHNTRKQMQINFRTLARNNLHNGLPIQYLWHYSMATNPHEMDVWRKGILAGITHYAGGREAYQFYLNWRAQSLERFTTRGISDGLLRSLRTSTETLDPETWETETIDYLSSDDIDEAAASFFIQIESLVNSLYRFWSD